jgi:N-acetylglucosaminyldiphosphoundecaprenol N-acetyl-beta-D-mannosaminyltransferase
VGAAFDYNSGTLKRAPHWIREIGLEWLFRLLVEPKRLWRRYLSTNPTFLFLMVKQLLKSITQTTFSSNGY